LRTKIGKRPDCNLGWFSSPAWRSRYHSWCSRKTRRPTASQQQQAPEYISRRDKVLVASAGPLFALVAAAGLAAVSRTILVCFETLLIFNFLILVHEIGHFLAAKKRGAPKSTASPYGFGTPIMKTRVNGIEYGVGFISRRRLCRPLPQMGLHGCHLKERVKAPPISLRCPPSPPQIKFIVAVAGPLFSFFCWRSHSHWWVWVVGKPEQNAQDSTHRLAGLIRRVRLPRPACAPVTRFWKWTAIRSRDLRQPVRIA